ncbi:MAG: aminoglycoside phosphotransferase family protein [bacterium]
MPERLGQLQAWLNSLPETHHYELTPASEDASFRRYFRLTLQDGKTLIAMDAPPDKENSEPYVRISGGLAAAGVHVPQLLDVDLDQGFMLMEDLGAEQYLDSLNLDNADQLYGEALGALKTMQTNMRTDGLPAYDRELLNTEMQLFQDWLLDKHLALPLQPIERERLNGAMAVLADAALEQPRVFVHRDYHSRNLMVCAQQNPGVIDFQDAVVGPVTYDLVSLLRDCYIEWPLDSVNEWALEYYRSVVDSGVIPGEVSEEQFLRWFDLMGAQRHLKAAGIFARLHHRDGKAGYLPDIPRTLGYIVGIGDRRPEISWLAEFIADRVLPAL